jgi:hypothetical protein
MSLIVEDGSVVAGAESYVTVEDADLYHYNRGMTAWTGLDVASKEQALRRATDFMLGRYRGRWKGAKTRYQQALDWPRVGVTPDDAQNPFSTQIGYGYGYKYVIPYTVVPNEVKNACCELALRAASGPLLADLEPRILTETVGPITVKYDPSSPQYIRYAQVDAILSPLLANGGVGATVKLTRT